MHQMRVWCLVLARGATSLLSGAAFQLAPSMNIEQTIAACLIVLVSAFVAASDYLGFRKSLAIAFAACLGWGLAVGEFLIIWWLVR